TLIEWIADESRLRLFMSGFSTWVLLAIIASCVALLTKGADVMIDGAVALARRTGLPKIVIGATIISLGTTTPEAVVSVMAAVMGNPGLALGNGVGSIIADTGLIFGLTCILTAVPVNRYILNRTGWVQVGSATLLVALAVLSMAISPEGPQISRWMGFLLLALLAWYLFATYRWARCGGSRAMESEVHDPSPHEGLARSLAMTLGGLAVVVVGARLMVPCAVEVAFRFRVPEDVIAATLVALGTSLPELVTAIAAVRKGHPEITVGNIVGADVLNCLFVIGAAASARPLDVPANFFTFHFPAMLVILFSFRLFIHTSHGKFRRRHGVWLLGLYLAYVAVTYALNVGSV
ncbi:MAG TPA: calcium/sodium antiporter, partial [bacterium]|nr:calcium/sodium antiporter [bacterium]